MGTRHDSMAAGAAPSERRQQPHSILGAGSTAPTASEVVIVPMGEEHIAGAARLHLQTFPDETLAQLGQRVAVAMYRIYLDSPRGIAFVATQRTEVVGVVSGVIGPGFVGEVLRRHRWLIFWTAALRVARSPAFIRQLAAIVGRGSDPWEGDCARRFYWRTQVIAPAWRGRGIIVPLIRALLLEAQRRGAREACSTVFDHNLAAVWVHKVLGFESRASSAGPRHYRLDLDRLGGDVSR
jgi:GNAT superfamily N-acetyltransferase